MHVRGMVCLPGSGPENGSGKRADQFEEMLVRGAVDVPQAPANPGIEGVEVVLYAGERELARLVTDEDGHFEYQEEIVGEGSILIRLAKEGFQPREVKCPLRDGRAEIVIEMERSDLQLQLTITDAQGEPLDQARVTFLSGHQRIAFALSDEEGRVSLTLPREGGSVTCRVARRGFRDLSAHFELSGDISETIVMGRWYSLSHLGASGWAKAVGLLLLAAAGGWFFFGPGAQKEPAILAFTVEPSQIQQRESATLSWMTENARVVLLNGKPVAEDTSLKVHPRQTTHYTLMAKQGDHEVSKQVTVTVKIPTRVLNDLVMQFMKVYQELRLHPAGKQLIPTEDPFQALVASGKANGMLRAGCRQEALDFAIDTLRENKGLQERQQAVEMAQRHMQKERKALAHADYGAIFKHISECKDFCRPLMSQLMLCHVQFVAEQQPSIVLFATNSHRVPPKDAEGLLARLAQEVKEDPAKKVWLMGRASKLGPAGYNQKLSQQRAEAVKTVLVQRGVDPSRVNILALGYEPPQLTHEISKRYGIEELYLAEGDQLINQSVVLVAY